MNLFLPRLKFQTRPARRGTVLAALLLAAGLLQNAGADGLSTLQLAPSAAVNSDGIYLQQVVNSDQTLPAIRLADAPDLGQTVNLTQLQISNLLAAASTKLTVSNWTGADTITISRKAHDLGETATLALLTTTLQKEYVKDKGELELNFTQPWVPPSVPDEPLTVRILEVPTAGVTHTFIIRFELCTARETVGTWQASLQAHVWHDAWVAHSDLERGVALSEADVVRERRDVLGVNESLAEFSTDDSTLEVASMVQAGNLLLARDLKPRAVMHRGQMADALLHDGALNIMMKVEVLEDGAPGQIVKIRNPVSLHNLSGKIVDDQTIMISL